ncbi:MAG: UDP-N-acetylmuramoyl-L-alanyl-D-glutamate--2,6-diaminopimelate ligase [Candidatus Kapaibacterium sp.]
MSKSIGELLKRSNDYELIGLPSQKVESLTYDSRKAKAGACFVAIKGENFDGHDFIEEAIWNGAETVVCRQLPDRELMTPDIAFIVTKNPRKLLAEISHAFYDYPSEKLSVIGVTGTNGKTTCTFLMQAMIESHNKSCGIIGTTGIFIGNDKIPATLTTPESLEIASILDKMVKSNVDYVAMEVSSHSLVQYRVHGINFKAAAFTNLTHDHLDYHVSMEEYAKAKKLLFEGLPEDSIAVVNTDDSYALYMLEGIRCKNTVSIGRMTGNDFKIMREHISLMRTEFLIYSEKQLIDVSTPLAGKFNIDNAALAAVTCRKTGIPLHAVQHGLSVCNGAPGRMERINLKNGAVALLDYAHTPDALEKALKSCKQIIENDSTSLNSKVICVFGCGGDRDKAKRPEMGKIAENISDFIIITSDNPRTEDPVAIIEDIQKGISDFSKVIVIPDRAEAIEHAFKSSESGDLILIAGKGHENYQIIGTEKLHFDDKEQIEKFKS